LIGVRLENVGSLEHSAPRLYAAARTPPPSSRVCLVAFRDDYRADAVERPAGSPSGPVAVVELAYPTQRLLVTLILARAPLHFGHSHFG
jgi:hypothetical protein